MKSYSILLVCALCSVFASVGVYGADGFRSRIFSDSLSVGASEFIYVEFDLSRPGGIFVLPDEKYIEENGHIVWVDEFRPWESPLDEWWSIPIMIYDVIWGVEPDDELEDDIVVVTFPDEIPSEYLTDVVTDETIRWNPAIVSDSTAKWAVIRSFAGYKKGERVGSRSISPIHPSGIMIYVDRDVVINSPAGSSHEWRHVELRKGWNHVTESRNDIYIYELLDKHGLKQWSYSSSYGGK